MSATKIFSFVMIVGVNLKVQATLFDEFSTAEQSHEDLQNCIKNITELNFYWNENILYSQWESNISTHVFDFWQIYQSQSYRVRTRPGRQILNRYIRFSTYIIVANNDNIAAMFKQLRSMDRWNARAKFIVLLEGIATDEIWKILISYYVLNIIVLQVADLQMFTYFPYQYENLREPFLDPVVLGHCNDYDLEFGSLSVSKVPKQWRNTTAIVAYMPLHPYVLDAEAGTGIEIELVDLMKSFMKYDVKYSTVRYIDWGVYHANNDSYTGPVGAVQRYEADFVIGHFHLRENERIIDFDTTFSYMDDDICWIVPIALIRSHWQNIMNIFDNNIWLLTIGSMFLSYVTWQFFNTKSPSVTPAAYRYYSNPLCSMEMPYLCFLGLPVLHEPQSLPLRFLFLVILLFCFILVTGWKSYLIVSLTHDTNEYQVKNLPDILESRLIFGLYYELIDLNCAEGTPDGDYVCRTADRNLCDASHRCLDRTAYKRDMTTITTKRIARYLSPQRYRTTNGREMIYTFKECMAKDYTVQYYTKGHPLFQRSNELLIWLRTSGFVDNLDKRLDHVVELGFQEYVSSLTVYDISVLGVMQMQGMFYLLMSGLIASVAAFILELYVYKHRLKISEYRYLHWFLTNLLDVHQIHHYDKQEYSEPNESTHISSGF